MQIIIPTFLKKVTVLIRTQRLCLQKMKGIILFVYNIYAYSLLIGMVLLTAPVLLLFLSFTPVSLFILLRLISTIWLFLVGISYKAIGNCNFSNQYIYVCNHSCYLDVIIMLRSIRGRYKPLGKSEMSNVPLIGLFYKKIVIAVKRNDSKSRIQSLFDLKYTIANHYSIFIFPEGTFNESNQIFRSFSSGAFFLATDMQLPVKPLLFLDNKDRMNASKLFSLTPGKCRVLFLPEQSPDYLNEKSSSYLKEKVYTLMETNMKEYISKN